MIRIAIIDDMLNKERIKDTICVEYVMLCDKISHPPNYYSHATISALILSRLCENISILNIVILRNKYQRGNVDNLIDAIDICISKKIDIISISLGSILMTDSYKIEQAVNRALKERIIIVAAANNDNVFTVPASLTGVIGVRREIINRLPVGRFFWDERNLLGIQCTVNCNFKDLGIDNYIPSNSYAVPIVVAEIAKNFSTEKDVLINRILNRSYRTSYPEVFTGKNFLYKWKEDVKVPNIEILIMDEIFDSNFFIELMRILHNRKQYLYVGVYNKFRIEDIRYFDMSQVQDTDIDDLYLFLSNAYFVDYTITVLQPTIDGKDIIDLISAQDQVIIEKNTINACIGSKNFFESEILNIENLMEIVIKISEILAT